MHCDGPRAWHPSATWTSPAVVNRIIEVGCRPGAGRDSWAGQVASGDVAAPGRCSFRISLRPPSSGAAIAAGSDSLEFDARAGSSDSRHDPRGRGHIADVNGSAAVSAPQPLRDIPGPAGSARRSRQRPSGGPADRRRSRSAPAQPRPRPAPIARPAAAGP